MNWSSSHKMEEIFLMRLNFASFWVDCPTSIPGFLGNLAPIWTQVWQSLKLEWIKKFKPMPGNHNYSGWNFPKSLWMSPMMSYKGYVHFPQSLMQWSSFCKPCDKSPPDQVVDIANLSQRWFRRMFSLSASPHGKSFNHIWWIFLTEQKSVKIFF